MSRSKREEQLKQNERYPLRSLTTEGMQAFLHEEALAERREADRQKRKEEKKEETQKEKEEREELEAKARKLAKVEKSMEKK